VIGFALAWEGQEHGTLWITGDTVLYDGVRQVADRSRSAPPCSISDACASRSPGRCATAWPLGRPSSCTGWSAPGPIPVHYEGWSHFRQDRPAIEGEFAQAPADISRSIRWPPIGAGAEVAGWPRTGWSLQRRGTRGAAACVPGGQRQRRRRCRCVLPSLGAMPSAAPAASIARSDSRRVRL